MTSPAARGAGRGLLLSALLLYALNLRGPITALAPVVSDVSAGLHLTAASAGLLTGAPVLCFALATPLAAAFVGRASTALVGTVTVVGVLAGTLLRSTGGFATALLGTVLIGVAITIGNVTVPVVVARDFSSGIAGVMGASTAAMNGGAVLTTIGMAPLAAVAGWRWALASWSVVALVALAVWWRAYGRYGRAAGGRASDEAAPAAVAARDEPRHDEAPHDETALAPVDGRAGGGGSTRPARSTRSSVLRRPLTWLFVVTFAMQSASYYSLSAWLPTVLHDRTGLSLAGSGGAAALFQGFGILGGVLAPVAMARLHPRLVAVLVAAAWLALPVGLLAAPAAWSVWASLGGVAQAANYVVIFSVVSTVAGSPRAAGRMSAAVQTGGYLLAGVAPSILGALHTGTAGWQVPLLVVAGALTLMGGVQTVAVGALVRHRAAVATAAAA